MDSLFFLLIISLFFLAPAIFIYFTYWVLKKSGRRKLGTAVSIILTVPFLLLTVYLLFDDLLFSKSDARKLLREHHITLNDDFKIISNHSGGLRDYTHQFELSISEKDKQSFINQRTWREKMDERIEVHTSAVDRYDGDTLRANYHDNDSYTYSMYSPNGKGIVPTFITIRVSKSKNTLTYEEILD